MKKVGWVLLLAVSVCVTGCATITKGVKQTLIFKLEPKETTCVLLRGDSKELGSISLSNNSVVVGKSRDDIIVKCEAYGPTSKTMRVVSPPYGGFWSLTDHATGAYWEYPETISIVLDKESRSQ